MVVSMAMGVTPKKWMVYKFIVDNPTKMDDNWGYPYLRKPPSGPLFIGKWGSLERVEALS